MGASAGFSMKHQVARDIARGGERELRQLLAARAEDVLFRDPTRRPPPPPSVAVTQPATRYPHTPVRNSPRLIA
jgi:hypothetical protein